ncbi:MAG TPA: threonylcarbamoyl-AMP synthase [Anaerolineaceae bacterium]|nr:MAG: threonylcarbamoyl-AMP synthase [Chloroflexi bacterium GWB2_54_36]HAL15247.1 threonylcarbamoyl-AMP synthase [Anaerolineaceae bacterium]HBA91254.1 threonylcarbamoyl-AMP synthase [Anaerolineaceae bacterium]
METAILPTTDPQSIPVALQVLQNGGLVAFPTDTVYGLAADPFNPAAIERLYAAKERDMSKAIAVLVGAVEQLAQITPGLSTQAEALAARFWPGALTLVVSRRAELPAQLSALPTIGVRMPDHSFALNLLQASGPLATTSANRSGADNPLTAADVLDQLGGRIELVLDGGTCPGGVPSTVVDCTISDVRVLREGAISVEAIRAVLAN